MPRQASWTLRRMFIVFLDCCVLTSAFYLAFLLRFPWPLTSAEIDIFQQTVWLRLIIYMVSYHFNNVYRGVYYYSSFSDMINIARGTVIASVMTSMTILFIRQGQFPRTVLITAPVLSFLGVCGVRFMVRIGKTWLNMPRRYTGEEVNVLLVGAGELGESILRQMLKTPAANYRVIGFLDDDSNKWGMRIHGYPIFGGRDILRDVMQRYQIDEIVIAIEARRGELVSDFIDRLKGVENKPELKIAPSLMEMLAAPGGVAVRKIRPADLLNREVVRLDEARIGGALRGKRVLVTGAGGTIGAELARQVLRYGPDELLLLESHATSLFYVEAQTREVAGGARIVPVLGDVRDRALIDRMFAERKPDVIFHAAAHKHVHQLERNVSEGVLNNALGTYYLCSAAFKNGAQSFLLVSTDKAVKPSSVMGATKRLAEIIVTSFAGRGVTRFMAVRFGNVLGSSGSVLPIFQEQLARGGPLTVTDPDVRRYFMTVEEAASLILQAVSLSHGGEIFVLKMGEPVRILDMAKSLIRLSGLEPDKDVEIRFTGLRQGEKMDEELIEEPSGCRPSEHSHILILRGENEALSDLDKHILDLEIAIRSADASMAIQRLRTLVPTFRPASGHEAPPKLDQAA
ncbi:MAG: polysaccharide biosynthesis protein [Elusimicrobia bacterium]|nr:polysaccharide biosynthesis protein [Elusimicrobiota bacterium]